MMEQPGSDVEPGGVIQTLQAGYELLGRLVRPAMVVVAAKTGAAQPARRIPTRPAAARNPANPRAATSTRGPDPAAALSGALRCGVMREFACLRHA
jgi:hypothetical protein